MLAAARVTLKQHRFEITVAALAAAAAVGVFYPGRLTGLWTWVRCNLVTDCGYHGGIYPPTPYPGCGQWQARPSGRFACLEWPP